MLTGVRAIRHDGEAEHFWGYLLEQLEHLRQSLEGGQQRDTRDVTPRARQAVDEPALNGVRDGQDHDRYRGRCPFGSETRRSGLRNQHVHLEIDEIDRT